MIQAQLFFERENKLGRISLSKQIDWIHRYD
jgi:hypothetical protein